MRKLIAVGIPAEEIVTVDGSQGKEAESVIVCLTRGSSSKHLLLLKRANVALTRSKRNLAVSAPPPPIHFGWSPLRQAEACWTQSMRVEVDHFESWWLAKTARRRPLQNARA